VNAPSPKLDWRQIDFTKPSVVSLIIANLIPLLGVLWLGWSTFAIVVIYWAECIILGAINVLKMITCSPKGPRTRNLRDRPGLVASAIR
jgi:hypothetical protein